MRKFENISLWLVGVLLICLCTCGLFGQGGGWMRELPGASIKLAVPEGQTVPQALDLAASAIISLGYEEQPFPEESRIDIKEYTKDNFLITYHLQDEAQNELNVIYIHFTQLADLFTDEGFAEYESLVARLVSVGLQPLAEDEADRKHFKWVGTPQMFNERQNTPTAQASRQRVLLFQLSLLASYCVIILWPGFSFALKCFNQLSIPYLQKRILFSVGTSLVLAPGLFLLPPFGPFLLVPLPLALLFALVTTTNELLIWAGVSFAMMLFIAFLISFLLRKSTATVTS